MISEFLESWDLFAEAWVAGALVAALLALVGVAVMARGQVFLGAAVSQASTLGVAAGLALEAYGVLPHADAAARALAVALAAGASWWVGRVRDRADPEAAAGWVFLACASLSVLIVAHSPLGMAEVERLVSSSLIGATWAEVWVFAALLALSGWAALRLGRPLLLALTDSETARAYGIRTDLWRGALALWLGLCVGLALRATGMLFSFGMLVLPTLFARDLGNRALPLFWRAPAAALAAAAVGFLLAHHWDLPPAQTAVALLAVAWLPARALGSARRR